MKTTNAENAYRTISCGLMEKLKELGRKEGCTSFMTLLGVFNVLLHRYTGLKDIIVGSPIANRRRHELEKLIGFFANILVFRTALSSEMSFVELLSRVRDTTLEAYEHQDVPFERLVDELRVKRDLSNTPIFQVMFVYENKPDRNPQLPGLDIEPYVMDSKSGSFDITLYVVEAPEGLKLRAAYNSDLFNRDTVERLLSHFEILVRSAIADPQQSIAELPLLSPEEQELQAAWNNTYVDFEKAGGIHTLFEKQVEAAPEAVAIHFEGKYHTYGELNKKANKLARYLQDQGIGPDDKVALFMERSLEIMAAMLGVLKAGAAYVPIDPVYPKDRVGYMLKEASAKLLITTSDLDVEAEDFRDTGIFCMDTQWGSIEGYKDENLQIEVEPSKAAYTIFTSGSTGRLPPVIRDLKSIWPVRNAEPKGWCRKVS